MIICSRNRPALLLETVESILSGRTQPHEVVIVDQSDVPNHDVVAAGERAGCSVVYAHLDQIGLSRARNHGARMARSSLLVLTDDDMLFDRAWFETIVERLAESPVDTAVTGRVPAAPPAEPDGFAPSTIDEPCATVYAGRIYRDVLFSNNMAIRKETFLRVGGFDERLGPGTRFPAAEDNDLGHRLLESGCTIRYVPDAIAYHRAWRSRDRLIGLRYAYAVGQGAFFAKHCSAGDPYGVARLGRDLIRYLGRAVRYAPRRGLRDTVGDVVYCGGLVSGMARWWLR